MYSIAKYTFYKWELVIEIYDMISKMKYDKAVEKYLVHHFNVTFKKIYNKLQLSIKLRQNKVIKEIHNFLRKIIAIKTHLEITGAKNISVKYISLGTIKLHAGLVICILLHNCTVFSSIPFSFLPS